MYLLMMHMLKINWMLLWQRILHQNKQINFYKKVLIPDLKKKITAAGQTDMNLNQYFKSNVNPGIVPNY